MATVENADDFICWLRQIISEDEIDLYISAYEKINQILHDRGTLHQPLLMYRDITFLKSAQKVVEFYSRLYSNKGIYSIMPVAFDLYYQFCINPDVANDVKEHIYIEESFYWYLDSKPELLSFKDSYLNILLEPTNFDQ